jgi:hypothetical protein
MPEDGFCTFDVRFTPTALGLRTATLTTTASGVGNLPPLVVTLTGVGDGPTIACPADITTDSDPGHCGATVYYTPPLSPNGTTDGIICVPPPGSFFPIGTTTVQCTSDSGAVCTFDVTVNDADPPVIGPASVSPPVLWPPNGKMVPVTVDYATTDNCGPGTVTTLTVTNNETGTADAQVIDGHRVLLRAVRAGEGEGRIYTITITTTDSSGNSSTRTVPVVVPHD